MLENSLYLSVFTSFEYFLKQIIDHYIEEKLKYKIHFSDLKEELARKIFLEFINKENDVFHIDDAKSKKAFSSYFNKINSPLTKEVISKYIKFEFLHESKLNTHYNMIFEQILGEKNFLKSIKIEEKSEKFSSNLEHSITEDAQTFLSRYCQEIRNKIAHENDKFEILENNSNENYNISEFSNIINGFKDIMIAINSAYENNTGYKLTKNIAHNILEI